MCFTLVNRENELASLLLLRWCMSCWNRSLPGQPQVWTNQLLVCERKVVGRDQREIWEYLLGRTFCCWSQWDQKLLALVSQSVLFMFVFIAILWKCCWTEESCLTWEMTWSLKCGIQKLFCKSFGIFKPVKCLQLLQMETLGGILHFLYVQFSVYCLFFVLWLDSGTRSRTSCTKHQTSTPDSVAVRTSVNRPDVWLKTSHKCLNPVLNSCHWLHSLLDYCLIIVTWKSAHIPLNWKVILYKCLYVKCETSQI